MKERYFVQIGRLSGPPDSDLIRFFKEGHSAYRFRGQGVRYVLVPESAFRDHIGLGKPLIHIASYHTLETIGSIDGGTAGEYVSGELIPDKGCIGLEGLVYV